MITDVLKGKEGSFQDVVILNAAASLCAAKDQLMPIKEAIESGIVLARRSIESGSALKKMELLKEYSNQ